jgi:hypothetical protein
VSQYERESQFLRRRRRRRRRLVLGRGVAAGGEDHSILQGRLPPDTVGSSDSELLFLIWCQDGY